MGTAGSSENWTPTARWGALTTPSPLSSCLILAWLDKYPANTCLYSPVVICTGRNTNTGRQESKALFLCSCHLVASLAGLVSSRDPAEPTQAKYLPGCTQIQAYTNTPISRGGVKMAAQLENTHAKTISHHKQCSQHALSLLPASMTPYFNSNMLFVINQQ